jgi:hypothetical protein
MHTLRTLLILALTVLLVGAAHGQVASMLATEGQPLPSDPDLIVDSISNPDANGDLGWAFRINVLDPSGAGLSLAYGTYLGIAPPSVLQIEGATDEYIQTAWESFFGMSDEAISYSPTCTRVSDGETGLDSCWLGDTIIAIEEEPFPYRDGWFWRFASRPGVTRDGMPYFVGGITDVQGGSTKERGLFAGPDGEPVYIGGMMINGLPDPVAISTSNVSFDFRFSAYGTYVIAEVNTETGSSTNDSHIVLNDSVLLAGGSPLSEASPVPESIGGLPGENWDNWDYLGVTEDGQWLVTGDTDGSTSQDEFLMLNGEIILREGDEIDGLILDGSMQMAYLGEDGDWACVWDGDTGTEVLEILIYNGSVVLIEGMPVDADGDGEIDADAILTDITGLASLAVSDRDAQGVARVYFTADVLLPDAVQADVDFEIVRADDELGIEEDVTVETGSRAEVEMAMVWVPEGAVPVENPELPGDQLPAARLALEQNYPNPFNPQTAISFSLPRSEAVRLDIVDLQGRLVRTLVDEVRAEGAHTVIWDGTRQDGRRVASGTYVYRLTTDARVLNRTLVLVK